MRLKEQELFEEVRRIEDKSFKLLNLYIILLTGIFYLLREYIGYFGLNTFENIKPILDGEFNFITYLVLFGSIILLLLKITNVIINYYFLGSNNQILEERTFNRKKLNEFYEVFKFTNNQGIITLFISILAVLLIPLVFKLDELISKKEILIIAMFMIIYYIGIPLYKVKTNFLDIISIITGTVSIYIIFGIKPYFIEQIAPFYLMALLVTIVYSFFNTLAKSGSFIFKEVNKNKLAKILVYIGIIFVPVIQNSFKDLGVISIITYSLVCFVFVFLFHYKKKK